MKYFITLVTLLSLTACESAEERAQRREQKEVAVCTGSGFTPGTAAFDDCRLQVRAREEQDKADRMSAFDGLQQIESNRHVTP